MAERGKQLIFGGGTTGLMGACARGVHSAGGVVIGVIPEALNEKGVVYEECDELVVTPGMRERKGTMDERADAFIALPGGFGTIEEIMEIITLKQLRYHAKPIVILNTKGFYTPLLEMLQEVVEQDFAKSECMELFYVTKSPEEALDYIDSYTPEACTQRWLTDVEAPFPEGDSPESNVVASPDEHRAQKEQFCKLEIFIPETHFDPLCEALRSVGAGCVGGYDSCLSVSEVRGYWRPLPGSNPYDGEIGVLQSAPELKVEVLCREERLCETVVAVKKAHPYEVPVINAIRLEATGL
jgi:uncharacterized protein (TIGR00730 family)